MSNDLPFNDYFEYFSPDFQLIPDPGPVKYDNLNNKTYIDNLRVIENDLILYIFWINILLFRLNYWRI